MERSNKLGFFPEISLKNGLTNTMEWYNTHKNKLEYSRFNVFMEDKEK